MRRIHFSDLPIGALRDVDQEMKNGNPGYVFPTMKPTGLWYSIEGGDDSWTEWCKAESYRDTDAQLTYELDVDLSRVLVLSTTEQMEDFSRRYAWKDMSGRSELDTLRMYIDWHAVAREYDGLEIYPYQWPSRMGLMWYYGWDCASGVLWRATRCATFKEVTCDKSLSG